MNGPDIHNDTRPTSVTRIKSNDTTCASSHCNNCKSRRDKEKEEGERKRAAKAAVEAKNKKVVDARAMTDFGKAKSQAVQLNQRGHFAVKKTKKNYKR